MKDRHLDRLQPAPLQRAREVRPESEAAVPQGAERPRAPSPKAPQCLGHDLTGYGVARKVAPPAATSTFGTAAMMPIQRRVEGWPDAEVNAGTTVFHVTNVQSARSIIEGGIQPVANQFGGGRLGSGFYTHTAMASAANYYEGDNPIGLEFTTARKMLGQVAPQDVYVGTTRGLDLAGNDFITAHEDREERCFRAGGLTIVAVHQGNDRFAPAEWMDFA